MALCYQVVPQLPSNLESMCQILALQSCDLRPSWSDIFTDLVNAHIGLTFKFIVLHTLSEVKQGAINIVSLSSFILRYVDELILNLYALMVGVGEVALVYLT